MKRSALVLLLGAALLSCAKPLSTPELLARGHYKAARDRAHLRVGRARVLLDAWVRARTRLTVSADAEEANLSGDAGPAATWPLRVRIKLKLVSAPLPASGFYRVYVRSAGLLWGGAPRDSKEWAEAAALQEMLGDGPPFAAWPGEDAALHAWSGLSLVCTTPSKPGDQCQTELLLMPMGTALGPDALVIDTAVEWPDSADILDQAHAQFILPLPPGQGLPARIHALFAKGPREVNASPREVARE